MKYIIGLLYFINIILASIPYNTFLLTPSFYLLYPALVISYYTIPIWIDFYHTSLLISLSIYYYSYFWMGEMLQILFLFIPILK